MEPIVLQSKQHLDIYINPQRQTILRCMRIAGEAMTPKQISDAIGISASSVQFHLQKLSSIGAVELSHTESIHGITARFYRVSPRTVSIGIQLQDGLQEQRLTLKQNALAQAFRGYAEYCQNSLPHTKPGEPFGDMLYGIVHLAPAQAKELYTLVRQFLETHEQKTPDSQAWEYTLIAYPTEPNQHE